MVPPSPDLTPVAVAITLLGVVVGPELADAAGAYSVIVLGWFAGFLIGLWRRPPESRIGVLAFLLVTLLLTLGVTVPMAMILSETVAKTVPWISVGGARGLLFPLAVILPAVGHSWFDVASHAWSAMKNRIARWGAQ